MNAAFLLMTACVAGADAAPPQTQAAPPAQVAPAPAPVYSVGAGGCSGCGGCDACGSCGCAVESEGLFSKLKGCFHRGGGGDCGCESHGSHFRGFGHHHGSDCGCDTGCASCGSSCDTCDTCGGHGGGFREKFRGLFHRGHHGSECGCDVGCGCDTGCGGCAGCGGCGGAVISPIPGGTMPKEQIGMPKEGEPKKLPSGDKPAPEKEKKDDKKGSVQLIPQPAGVPGLDLAPAAGKSPF